MKKRSLVVGGLRMNVVEAGTGPDVVLLHGFLNYSYSWRHQVRDLAAAGYHVLAPDLRGYGETGRPEDVGQYSVLHLVGDVVGLLDAFRIERATVVGHDWGAMLAWNTALMRPDRVRGVVGMSVPYVPRGDISLLTLMRERFGDLYYMQYFQEQGPAERELARDVAATFRGVLGSGSEPWDPVLPEGGGWLDCLPDKGIPDWLAPADLDAHVAAFERTGFTGALNWYRNLERNHELTAAWQRAKIQVPALFLYGTRDAFAGYASALIDDLPNVVPHLRSVVRLDAGHWVQQERPDEVTAALVDFLERDRPDPRVRDLTC
ncbi:pimeloyl-ACP methyl ester carboxylesterase [Catenulispora sp. GP43]|uniref:alpha/beta fold hydrolase n=1 Tax=Catenulispora sp. GP43 TaxID=3156263 RepID=UPI0035185B23